MEGRAEHKIYYMQLETSLIAAPCHLINVNMDGSAFVLLKLNSICRWLLSLIAWKQDAEIMTIFCYNLVLLPGREKRYKLRKQLAFPSVTWKLDEE
jgi:NADH:ubiquinone oxidoreductase subunit 4 (subunit M)